MSETVVEGVTVGIDNKVGGDAILRGVSVSAVIGVENKGIIEILSGTIKGTGNSYGSYGIYNLNQLFIESAEEDKEVVVSGYIGIRNEEGTVEIDGENVTVTIEGKVGSGIVSDGGSVTITNGHTSEDVSSGEKVTVTGVGYAIENDSGTINIDGGKIVGGEHGAIYNVEGETYIINITRGYIEGDIDNEAALTIIGNTNTSVIIKGDVHNVSPGEITLERVTVEGKVENDSTMEVKSSVITGAEIGVVNRGSIVLDSVEVEGRVYGIDNDGGTVVVKDSVSDDGIETKVSGESGIYNDAGDVTIQEGTIKGTSLDSICIPEGGKIYIKGGTFEGNLSNTSGEIYIGDTQDGINKTITIKGTLYNFTGAKAIIDGSYDSIEIRAEGTAISNEAGTLTITKATVVSEEDVGIYTEYDKLELNNVTISAKLHGVYNCYEGEVVVNGGSITSTSTYTFDSEVYTDGKDSYAGIYSESGEVTVKGNARVKGYNGIALYGATLEMENGTVEGILEGIRSYTGSEATVNGGKVTGEEYGITNRGKVTINGESVVEGATGIANYESGELVVNSGEIKGTTYAGIYDNGTGTRIEILSGTVRGKKYGIQVASSLVELVLGTKDADIDLETPEVIGEEIGIYITYSGNNYEPIKFYDGIIKGKVNACGTKGCWDYVGDLIEGYGLKIEVKEGYEVAYLVKAYAMIVEEEFLFESVQDAIDYIKTSEAYTIKMLNNPKAAQCIVVPSGRNILLDMQSYTISCDGVAITNNGTLRITSLNEEGLVGKVSGGTSAIVNAGVLVIEKGEYESIEDNVIENGQTGNLTIEGGTVRALSSASSVNAIENSGYLEIAGDTSLVGYEGVVITGVYQAIYNKGTLEISGASIEAETYGITADNDVTVANTIIKANTAIAHYNGEFVVNAGAEIEGNVGVSLFEEAKLVINGGEIKGATAIETNNVDVVVEINGGNIEGKVEADLGSIEINGGTIKGQIEIDEADVEIKGGTVTNESGYAVVGESFKYTGGVLRSKKSETVMYSYSTSGVDRSEMSEYTQVVAGYYETEIKEVAAKIGNESYGTLEAAIEAAEHGETIVMQADVTVGEIVLVKSLNIDLNGYEVNNHIKSMPILDVEYDFITIRSGASVEIKGNGAIATYNPKVNGIYNEGKITVSGGAQVVAELYAVINVSGAHINFNGEALKSKTYSEVFTSYYRDMDLKEGSHVEYTLEEDGYNVARIVDGRKLDSNMVVKTYISLDENNEEEALHIEITQNNFAINAGELKVYLRSTDDELYEEALTCVVVGNVATCVIDFEELEEAGRNIAYLTNALYRNELVVVYKDTIALDIQREDLYIERKYSINLNDITILDSINTAITDGEIILLTMYTDEEIMTLSEEDLIIALFGTRTVITVASITGVDTSGCTWAGDGWTRLCTTKILIEFEDTNTSIPTPESVEIPVVVYDYAPKVVVVDKGELSGGICEVGKACEIKDLSFIDISGNEVQTLDTVITTEGQVVNSINTKKLGSYTVTTIAIDENGNKSRPVVREYRVVDATAPIIIGNDVVLKNGEKYDDSDMVVVDNYDDTVTIERVSDIDLSRAGTYRIEYRAVDSSGNVTTFFRTVVVQPNYTMILLVSMIAIISIGAVGILFVKKKRRA